VRVVCPYTSLHPLAEQALADYAPLADCLELHEADDYYKLLCELWAAGEAFLVVEHDIEIHEGVLPALETCPEPWCLYGYGGPTPEHLFIGSLGCTRFSAALLTAVPALMTALPVRHWQRLDCEILPALRTAGFEPHVHEPPVLHHHVYNDCCACGKEH
jgi:hypothetical protein